MLYVCTCTGYYNSTLTDGYDMITPTKIRKKKRKKGRKKMPPRDKQLDRKFVKVEYKVLFDNIYCKP